MADVPNPITGENLEDIRYQVYELIRVLYEDKIGGADLGDTFSIVGDVLTLVLASASGLTKRGNELAISPISTGGLQISTTGLSVKILSTGGLETDASGLGIKLDGASLALSASGLKLSSSGSFSDITLNNDGLHLLDTDASHDLIVSPGSDLSADRVLTLTTGDAARTITLSGNPTLGDWFDQSLKQADSPTLANLTLSGLTASQLAVTDASKQIASLALLNVALGGTGLSSFTAGDLMYATAATVLSKLAKGSANTKLFMNAGATDPEWSSGVHLGEFSRDTATATGTQAVTGVGFKPSNIIFLSIVAGTAQVSIGFGNVTTNECALNKHDIHAGQWSFTTSAVYLAQAAGINYTGAVTSLDSDGFTISWTKTGAKTGSVRVYYMAIR